MKPEIFGRSRFCCINERIRSLISRGDNLMRIMNINVQMKSQCCADADNRREQKADRKENTANLQRNDKNQNILTHLAVNQAGILLRSLSALCVIYTRVLGSLVRHLFTNESSYHVIFFAFSSYLLQSIQLLLRPFSSFCSFVRRVFLLVASSSHIFTRLFPR